MRRLVVLACLLVASLAGAHASAQDVVTGGRKQGGPRYEIKMPRKKPDKDKAAAGVVDVDDDELEDEQREKEEEQERMVDPQLVELMAGKIRACYREEAGKDLSPEDQKLVDEYKVQLVREFEAGIRETTCHTGEPASQKCLTLFDALSCEDLGKVIKAKRWDKHLLPEERKALMAYTGALTRKKSECSGEQGDQETDAIVQDVEASKLAVLAQTNMAVGKCVLDMQGEQACKAHLDKMSCKEVERAQLHSKLVFLCPMFLRCKNVGPKVE